MTIELDALYDRMALVDHATLGSIVDAAGGAAYVIAPDLVARNVRALRTSLQAAYSRSHVAYSFKTSYTRSCVAAARREGALDEVVSALEYDYAGLIGDRAPHTIVNGPGKDAATLRHLLAEPVTLIADSLGELDRIATLASEGLAIRARLGFRAAPHLSFVSRPSRFGIDLDDPAAIAALRAFEARTGLHLSGIHLHISESRSIESFEERIAFLVERWQRVSNSLPEFIDCGGGLASAMPDSVRSSLSYAVADLHHYGHAMGTAMARAFPGGEPELICEPGTGVLADVGVFVTPVLDTKIIGGRRIAVVDGTLFTVNPLRSPIAPAARLVKADRACGPDEQWDIFGNSCMDIDLLAAGFTGDVRPGDMMVMAQKGAYAACMGAPFIQGIPAVVEWSGPAWHVARPRTDATLLAHLH